MEEETETNVPYHVPTRREIALSMAIQSFERSMEPSTADLVERAKKFEKYLQGD